MCVDTISNNSVKNNNNLGYQVIYITIDKASSNLILAKDGSDVEVDSVLKIGKKS